MTAGRQVPHPQPGEELPRGGEQPGAAPWLTLMLAPTLPCHLPLASDRVPAALAAESEMAAPLS